RPRKSCGIILRGNFVRQLWFAGQRRGGHGRPTMVCSLLEGVAQCEQSSFRKLAAQELDTHRAALWSKSGRHGQGGKRNERREAAVVAQIADASRIRDRERFRGNLSGRV